MKSGASDPFGDSEDERSESSESRTESEANRERGESEDEQSEPSENSNREGSNPRNSEGDEDERSESSENQASRAEPTDEAVTPRDDEADPAVEGGTDSEEADGSTEDDGSLNRDELPLVLRRDRVKDERPEVHQLFVQQGTHDRAVDAERALEKRLGVDLSRTDAREAIYLAGMAHLDDAEEILRTWGYDL